MGGKAYGERNPGYEPSTYLGVERPTCASHTMFFCSEFQFRNVAGLIEIRPVKDGLPHQPQPTSPQSGPAPTSNLTAGRWVT